MGRRTGSQNRGYYYRAGRGWVANVGKRMVPLQDDEGNPLRDKSTTSAMLKSAYRRIIAQPEEAVNGEPIESLSAYTVEDVCNAYLSKAEADDSESTYNMRADTLFDFCTGFPARFRPKQKGETKATPQPNDRVHKGYGNLPVSKLLPLNIDQWLAAHKGWKRGKRTRIQAIKRAMNYGVKCGLIPEPPGSPLKGYKTPRAISRITYITPEQESALYRTAKPAFALALKVCIRTGVRPGSEFAKLTAKHVKENGKRMQLVFQVRDHKTGHQTGKQRIVWITDPEIIEIVHQQIEKHPQGAIFRNTKGTPWRYDILNLNFRRAKARLKKQGIELDDDAVMYSCRHTYAKRVLHGYWTGKQTNIENLARLMGTSPQVCRDHYLQWTNTYEEPLWDCA